MKKFLILVLTLAMILSMTACSSGKENKPNEDPDKMSEKEFEEHFNELDKEIEEEENRNAADNGDEADNGNEADNGIDLTQTDIVIEKPDAYELGILKAFGLDNDFPKPKEGHKQKWRYFRSHPFEADPVTGDIREGVEYYTISMSIEEDYTNYWNEVRAYIESKYEGSEVRYLKGDKSQVAYFDDNGCTLYVEYPTVPKGSLSMNYGYWRHGTVERIVTGDYTMWDEKFPSKILVEEEGAKGWGNFETIHYSAWAEVDTEQEKVVQTYIDMQQFPKEGDKVRIEYMAVPGSGDSILPEYATILVSLEIIE